MFMSQGNRGCYPQARVMLPEEACHVTVQVNSENISGNKFTFGVSRGRHWKVTFSYIYLYLPNLLSHSLSMPDPPLTYKCFLNQLCVCTCVYIYLE